MKNNIFGEPVLHEAVWTSEQLSKMLDITMVDVRNYTFRLKIHPTKMKNDKGVYSVYNYDDYIRIKDLRTKILEKKELAEQRKKVKLEKEKIKPAKKKVEEVQEDVEELKKAHPLVRDERLFNLNYWPDVVPVCFEEEGEEEV